MLLRALLCFGVCPRLALLRAAPRLAFFSAAPLASGARASAAAAPVTAAAPRRGFAVHAGTFRTPSSIKKRFRIASNGSILRAQGGKSHLNRHKSSARVARLGKIVALSGGIRARYLRALQKGKLA